MSKDKTLQKLQKVNRAQNDNGAGIKSYTVTVNKYYTNVDGTLVGKNSATIPIFARVSYPVYLFGTYDFDGGYFIAQKAVPPLPGLFYIFSGVYGSSFNLLNFTGGNNVKQNIKAGDLIILFSDSDAFPNFFIWIVISGDRRAYGSFMQNPIDKGLNVFNTKYFVDSIPQFSEKLLWAKTDEQGNYKSDSINPYMYIDPDYELDNLSEINLNYQLNNWNGWYFYMQHNTDLIQFIYKYKY